MEREAVLLYLENIRDLEVARARLLQIWDQQTNHYFNKIKPYTYGRAPLQEPVKSSEPEPAAWWEWLLGIFTICFWISVIIADPVSSGDPKDLVVVAFAIILTVVWGIFFGKRHTRSEKYNEQAYQVALWSYEDAVKQRKLDEENDEKMKAQWENWLDKQHAAVRKELDKVEDILYSFYWMNLIPKNYRFNLAAICFIYDWMSSTQDSLRETLVSAQIENGIRRIEAKMNEMMVQLKESVYETRCMRAENKAQLERTIELNQQMLSTLEQIDHSAGAAADYAELAANYSKANAYFSLATYLK